MEKRELGKSGIKVAPFCLGGNVFGWTIDEQTSFKVLDAFAGEGMDFIDTADVYSTWANNGTGGQSETVIGNWLKKSGKRNDVIIATKVGKPMGGDKKGLSAKYIAQAAEDSLRRLQTDHIDLYQSHEDDSNTPFDETFEAFEKLIKEGKVRTIGASNFSGDRLKEALTAGAAKGFSNYQTLQPEYNLYNRQDYEKQYEDICLEKGLRVISYFSLASGFLTGKYRSEADFDKSKRGGGMSKYLNDRGKRILAALDDIAAEYNATPAAVSLAWLIARPSITAPIASATSVDQLKQILKSLELNLSAEAVAKLDEASAY
ncbi:aldo/keto reductase [Mucilaginibacter ginkgonis]|uniref:Aldo/keto reductase n=1 Tax=Mucilaginibacter ginkgonis TaxID=2682091 RepID=A0A6I4I0V5_9SPHI|nr:aldo/keto reductase [Mucilaginibacter ginkgonis]QQL51125.1 aldo/keto reductase [Mucilaginibacter ginkgonis]